MGKTLHRKDALLLLENIIFSYDPFDSPVPGEDKCKARAIIHIFSVEDITV